MALKGLFINFLWKISRTFKTFHSTKQQAGDQPGSRYVWPNILRNRTGPALQGDDPLYIDMRKTDRNCDTNDRQEADMRDPD